MNRASRDHSGNARSAASNPRCYGYYLPVHCEDELDGDVRALAQTSVHRRPAEASIVGCLCQPRMLSGFTETPYNSPARQRFLFDTVILLRYAFGWHERRASSSSER